MTFLSVFKQVLFCLWRFFAVTYFLIEKVVLLIFRGFFFYRKKCLEFWWGLRHKTLLGCNMTTSFWLRLKFEFLVALLFWSNLFFHQAAASLAVLWLPWLLHKPKVVGSMPASSYSLLTGTCCPNWYNKALSVKELVAEDRTRAEKLGIHYLDPSTKASGTRLWQSITTTTTTKIKDIKILIFWCHIWV